MPPSDSRSAAARLLPTFGLIATLVVLIVSGALLIALGRETVSDIERGAIKPATVAAAAVVGPALSPSDLSGRLSSSRRRQIDAVVRKGALMEGIYKVKLFGPDGRFVYASDGELTGNLVPAAVATALRMGTSARVLESPARASGKAIEVLVPLRAGPGREATGIMQAFVAYEGVAARESQQRRSFAVLLLIAGLAIVALLVIAVHFVSRELRASALSSDHLAKHDALTGVANRRQLTDALGVADRGAKRRHFALAVLDVDGFKGVNDTLGHEYGDYVLKTLAARISSVVRPDDLVARIGGDEFALLMRGSSEQESIEGVCQRIVKAVQTPIDIGGAPVILGASIGIAVSPGQPTGTETLIRNADRAMYIAKTERTGVEFYRAELGEADAEVDRVSTDLRRALGSNELVVCFQPQAGLDGRLVGLEALVHWQHPARGLIPPDSFISIAERTGLIRPLTQVVLREALRESARLRASGIDLAMAVNLSSRLLGDRSLPVQIAELLAQQGVPANRLTLEITESSLTENRRKINEGLKDLSALGLRIAVDDWGTGCSSLQHMRSLPVDILKIDDTLIRSLGQDPQDTLVVESAISLARGLGLEVVAEGVEAPETWHALARLGCNVAQGFLLAKPMSSAELEQWLSERFAARTDSRSAA